MLVINIKKAVVFSQNVRNLAASLFKLLLRVVRIAINVGYGVKK
jgi:hypothetical protein